MIVPYVDPDNPRGISAVIEFDDEEIRQERRTFNVSTYGKLRASNAAWDRIAPANDVLNTLDRDEYSYMVKLYIRAKRDLSQVHDCQSMTAAILAIDEKVAKTFGKLNMSERILKYVMDNHNISMPDLTSAGTRPQDSDAMTFFESDYNNINTIVIIAKLLFPIFGEVINRIQFIEALDNDVKEIVAFGIVKSLLNRDFHDIVVKLHNYIGTIVKSTMSDDPMIVYYGFTETSLTYDKLARTVVKNAVNHDLYRKDGNIMKSIAVTTKRSIKIEGRSGKGITYKSRIAPEKNTGFDVGKNLSSLENESHILKEAIEVPMLVRVSIERFISDYISVNNINTTSYQKAVEYYRVTAVPPTPVNELIVALFVSSKIGSAYCVRYMNMEMMTSVITLIQIYAMSLGYQSIVPLLTSISTGMVKIDTNEVDNNIILSDGRGAPGKTNYYVAIREMLTHLDGFQGFNLGDCLKDLMLSIVATTHRFNVAQTIGVSGEFKNTVSNDGILQYDIAIINDLYQFIYHLMIPDFQERRIG